MIPFSINKLRKNIYSEEQAMEKGKRNASIDVFRGIAALMIVLHHVACYSGAVYSPYEIIPSTMIVDVPAFLFISGWTFQYTDSFTKIIKRLLRLVLEYVIFSAIYVVFIEVFEWICFSKMVNIEELLYAWVKQSIFRGENHEIFSVVNASLWFMPMYIKVYVVFGIIILAVKRLFTEERWQRYIYIVVTIVSFGMFFFMQKGNSIPGLSVTILFYGTFFMMGYILMSERTFPIPYIAAAFVVNLLILIGLENFTDMSIYGMVNNKFPPSILFFVYSLFYIMIMLASGHFSVREIGILSYAGKNAVYFFFAQGFAVSLINLADDFILIQNWVIKYMVSCFIAIVFTVIIAIILKKLIEYVFKIVTWVVD